VTVWAITAYFNPGRFRRRYANYQTFRKALKLPLLTIEWSPEARFDLDDEHADVLVRVSGGALMWQKERLLNIAVSRLPAECDLVAWLDCDVVFSDERWISELLAESKRSAVTQLFSRVVHLPATPARDAGAASAPLELALLTRTALASRAHAAQAPIPDEGAGDDAALPDAQREARELARLAARPSSGHAWAARRELLADHGLYDACVCGAGDMALALAALGRPEAFLAGYPLNDGQRAHYEAWAARFGAAVGGAVGCLQGTLFHLFHGRMVDRQYRTRLARLADSGFDPARDLLRSAQGAWEWAAPDDALARFLAEYFRDRREDA
jgi:hypothetical protein